jgi:transcriptional regulator with GAF, ATPase, and Fis domain
MGDHWDLRLDLVLRDLYYRLNVFPIEFPPLRERNEDVLMLLHHFVDLYARRLRKKFGELDERTIELFRSDEWPGNIRELQNVVERAVILRDGYIFSVDEVLLQQNRAYFLGGRSLTVFLSSRRRSLARS